MRLWAISWKRQTQCVKIFLSSFTHHYDSLVARLSNEGTFHLKSVPFFYAFWDKPRIKPLELESPVYNAGRNCSYAVLCVLIYPPHTSKCQHENLSHCLLTQIFCKTFLQPLLPVSKPFQNQSCDVTIQTLTVVQGRGWPGLELTLLERGGNGVGHFCIAEEMSLNGCPNPPWETARLFS